MNDALNKIEPTLKNALKVMSSSASSFISIDGAETHGLRGIHTFIPVDKTMNNKDILDALYIRSVNAGYAYPKITKAGTIKINSLIDKALCTSNQPIFEGGAILKNESIKQKRVIQTFDGEILQADSISTITIKENAKFKEKCKKLKAAVQEVADEIRQKFIAETSQELVEKNKKLTDENARKAIIQAIQNSRLSGEFLILLESGQEVTVQEILDNPIKYHEVPCAHPLDNEIMGKSIIYCNQDKPLIYTFAHGGETFFLGLEPNEAVKQDWQLAYQEFVLEFNIQHAQVLIDKKHKIMRMKDINILNELGTPYELIQQDELRKMYSNELIQVGEKFINNQLVPVLKDKITAWTSHKDCRKYLKGMFFEPGKVLPEGYYNIWQGFAIKPCAGASTKLIKDHIELVICKGDFQQSQYFYNWLAYGFQNPEKPVGTAIVLRGEKGCGKGIIGHSIKRIWGQHGIYITNSRHLVGNFNAHLHDKCFLFADEAYFAGDKGNEGVLKSLITDPSSILEKKGIDADPQPNYLKILMVTNNDHAVQASKDERRYCVFDVSSERIGDRRYFEALLAACNDPTVLAAFLNEMLNRDISNFHPGDIPETQGLKDQRLASLDSIGKWLADSFSQGYFAVEHGIRGLWEEKLSSHLLYKSYLDWCNSRKLTKHEIESPIILGKYFKTMFISKKLKGDIRGYILGSLNEAILKFEKYEKVDLGIEVDDRLLDIDSFLSSNDEYESSKFNFGMISKKSEKPVNFNFN